MAELEGGGRNADHLVSLGGKPRNEEKAELEGGNHNAEEGAKAGWNSHEAYPLRPDVAELEGRALDSTAELQATSIQREASRRELPADRTPGKAVSESNVGQAIPSDSFSTANETPGIES